MIYSTVKMPSLGELFDLCLKLFIYLALFVHLLESSARRKQANKYACLLEFWLHCSQHSTFTYSYSIVERGDRISRELDTSAEWDT